MNVQYSFSRFQSPEKVSILPNPKGDERVNISAEEKNNPLYEPGESHTYCSIEDAQDQYKKEIGLSTKPSQSTLYETPTDPGASTSSNANPYEVSPLTGVKPPKLDPKQNDYETPTEPGASTSSFNPLYDNSTENSNSHQGSNIEGPTSESSSPLLPATTSTSSNTPESHYKTPNNPYDTMLPPKNEAQGAYDVSPMNSQNNPPRASYENVPNSNNTSHYQTPSAQPDDVYEVMTGKDLQINQGNTGTTQC